MLSDVLNTAEVGNIVDKNSITFSGLIGSDDKDVNLEKDPIIIRDDVPAENIRPCDSMEFLTNDIAVIYWRKFIKKYFEMIFCYNSTRASNEKGLHLNLMCRNNSVKNCKKGVF